MSSNIITTTGRSINTITTEIRTITQQARQVLLSAAIEIGRRLTEAKTMVPHGEWGTYLQQEVEFSQSTANNFMRLYEEYGDNQQSLFGSNSQALGNLSYTKALLLLAVPAEERSEFAEDHKVEAMSTRELEKAIKERDEARAEAEKAQQLAEKTQAELRKVDTTAAEQRQLAAHMKNRAEAAEEKLGRVTKLEEDLKKAKEAKVKAEKELKAVRDNPQVPEAVLQAMRKEAEVAAADKAQKAIEKALADARAQARQAETDRDLAQKKLAETQKAARIADPDLMAVQVLGQQVQSLWNTMLGHKKKAVTAKPENEGPLTAFLQKLLETMHQGLK